VLDLHLICACFGKKNDITTNNFAWLAHRLYTLFVNSCFFKLSEHAEKSHPLLYVLFDDLQTTCTWLVSKFYVWMHIIFAWLHIGYNYWRVGTKTLLLQSRGLTKVSKQPHESRYWVSIGPELRTCLVFESLRIFSDFWANWEGS